MPATDEITDDYVTELLKRDAKAASASASARSLGQLLNKRPASSAPKPNTRFLRNILRDTDNHNAALLAKEADESRARLKKLRQSGRPDQQLYSARDRHDSKRRRLDPAPSHASASRSRHDPSPSSSSDTHRRRRRRHSPDSRDRDRRSTRRSSTSRHGRTEPHASSSRPEDYESRKRHRRSRHASSSPDSRSTLAHDTQRPRHSDSSRKRKLSLPSEASDSDPLDAIIGPAPPPSNPPLRSRGRGAFNTASTIDDHFSSNYDPSADVQVDSRQHDDLDWDNALEALRDRAKWKQQGADRLRAAGFSERHVAKWEKGGERSEEDVVWSKKGEGREWDRGKVLDDDGLVNVKPEWGRLKDT